MSRSGTLPDSADALAEDDFNSLIYDYRVFNTSRIVNDRT